MQKTNNQNSLYSKKGQMSSSVSTIIMLIVGVGVSVMVIIFVGSLGGQTYELVEADINAIGNNTIVGETFEANNATAQLLNFGDVQNGTMVLTNGSNALEVGLGNFTINYDTGSMLLKGGVPSDLFNGSTITANYTHGLVAIRDSIKGGVVSSFEALEQTGNYLPIVVLAVIIAIVLGVVLSFGTFKGFNGSGGGAL